MSEEKKPEELASANMRKLAEHLKKMQQSGGQREENPDAGAGAGAGGGTIHVEESPPSAEEVLEGALRSPPGLDAGTRARWEAWKKMHGDRIHEIRPDEVARDADPDDYRLLGVSPGASRGEIKRAFYRLAKTAHPDRGGDPEEFHKLRLAYGRITKDVSLPPAEG